MNEFGIINTNMWQETKLKSNIKTFVNTEDPKIMHVIQTGWEYPKMYIVVVEDGEKGKPESQFLSEEDLFKHYSLII
jgi:hypothetical protein